MLTHLQLRDFAIVERLELEFAPGMTVLTGETGAGKSILIDALGLAIGERASQAMVRPRASRAEVVAVFEPGASSAASEWLLEHELDNVERECVLRRSVSSDGRSRAYINDRPVPVQTLRDLGDLLIDIHGQHAHQSLLRRDVQRHAVDAHANHAGALSELGRLHRRWRELTASIDTDVAEAGDRDDRLAFLRYQRGELESLEPSCVELERLAEEQRMLSHGGDLLDTCARVLSALDDDDPHAVLRRINAAARDVDSMYAHDPGTKSIAELIESGLIQLQEATQALRSYADRVDTDPARLAAVDARLGALHTAARKHRVKAEELEALLQRWDEEIEFLERSEERLSRLREELSAANASYQHAARRVHAARVKAAAALGRAVTENMQALGMAGGCFEVVLTTDFDRPPAAQGADRIEFTVSANPGQPPRPLAQVASGGELSRVSLSIQVLETRDSAVPTLIFDEVDAGIGAGVADIVGTMLRSLGSSRQVLCVTHLPQIASHAHHHVGVHKRLRRGVAETGVAALRGDRRVQEVARMLGGMEITEQSLAHAREMLEKS